MERLSTLPRPQSWHVEEAGDKPGQWVHDPQYYTHLWLEPAQKPNFPLEIDPPAPTSEHVLWVALTTLAGSRVGHVTQSWPIRATSCPGYSD